MREIVYVADELTDAERLQLDDVQRRLLGVDHRKPLSDQLWLLQRAAAVSRNHAGRHGEPVDTLNHGRVDLCAGFFDRH